MERRGLFITFEGGEGVGKSTQIARLAARLERLGYEVLVLREPGSTPIGEKIRSILLDSANGEMAPAAELLLYEAARAQIIEQVVKPAIDAGKAVLCDRFTDSTMAYQGYARGLGIEVVEAANRLACGGFVPDRTLLLERDQARALADARGMGGDRIEMEPDAFHDEVRKAFRQIAEREPNRIRTVWVTDDIDVTEERVFEQVKDLVDGR